MKQCLYCKGKLEQLTKGFSKGQQRCVSCKAIFIQEKTRKSDYECDENGN